MWQLLLQHQRRQKEDDGRVSSTQRTRQKSSSCDSLENAGNKSGRADLWQLQGRWHQLLQETRGMWMCCGLYPPQAIAAGLHQATTFHLLYCIYSSWCGCMDRWANLMISVGMLQGITVTTFEMLKYKADQSVFYFFILFFYTTKVQKILAVMQTWTQAHQQIWLFTNESNAVNMKSSET